MTHSLNSQSRSVGIEDRTVEVKTSDGPENRKYALIRPPKIDPDRRYPLLVFLHGAGSRGDDNRKQLTHFPKLLLDEQAQAQTPCFAIAPQCRAGARWAEVDWSSQESTPLTEAPSPEMQYAIAALMKTLRDEPIDRQRVALTGLSMGSFGTWDLACRHPYWFSAIGPICGGGDENSADRLVGTPTWVWHGDQDRAVPVERSRIMVERMRSLGGDPQYTELPGRGHDSWKEAYGDEGMTSWLVSARQPFGGYTEACDVLENALRGLPAQRIVFFGDSITQAGISDNGYITVLNERVGTLPEHVRPVLHNAGISGHRVPDLLERMERDVIEENPTVVFVYIGINDVWHRDSGRGTPEDVFLEGMTTLTKTLKDKGAKVVLATPTLIGEKAQGANKLDSILDSFAGITREVAAANDCVLCDYRADFLAATAFFNEDDRHANVLTGDGVHMNDAGNRLLARGAAVAISQALRKA